MRFIFNYPEMQGSSPSMLDSGPVADLAVACEQAGWSGFSFTEHPAPGERWLGAGGHQALDPFLALAHVAAVTERLKLLTYLTVVPYRNPLMLAKQAATLDLLSNGRFILGVGTGYLKGEFRALGVDFEQRNALFDEALEVMPLHWSGEPFDYEGISFSAKGIQARPQPTQARIPIWIGGNAKITRRRVAEKAQGWMPLPGPPEMSATTRTPSVGTLDDLGQRIAEVKEAAGERGAELDFVYLYADPRLAEDPTASVEEHRDAMARFAEIGITYAVANGPSNRNRSQSLEWIQAVGETYLGSA